jgi:hypothetical protein
VGAERSKIAAMRPEVGAERHRPDRAHVHAVPRPPTSVEEDIALLKQAGILTKSGKLAKLYTSWGDKVSRPPEIDESGEMHG